MEFNGTFLVVIITFVVFVFLMNKILYAPILGIMQQRKDFIDGNYKAVSENDSKTEELTNEKNEKLADAKDEARGKYVETVDGFKAERSEKLQDAQNLAREELERSRDELENLSNEVKAGLKNRMNELANDITEKILGYRSETEGCDNEAVDRVLWGGGK